jgi:hypothetical protein
MPAVGIHSATPDDGIRRRRAVAPPVDPIALAVGSAREEASVVTSAPVGPLSGRSLVVHPSCHGSVIERVRTGGMGERFVGSAFFNPPTSASEPMPAATTVTATTATARPAQHGPDRAVTRCGGPSSPLASGRDRRRSGVARRRRHRQVGEDLESPVVLAVRLRSSHAAIRQASAGPSRRRCGAGSQRNAFEEVVGLSKPPDGVRQVSNVGR